jgi:hypothetical protein
MKRGFTPQEMEDRWYIYFDRGWLYFHRSWTGFCTFWVKLEDSVEGARIVEAYASRDRTQYRGTDAAADAQLLLELIETLLISRTTDLTADQREMPKASD